MTRTVETVETVADATFLAHTPMGGPFAVGSHHLAAAMAADGLRVNHISLPVTPLHLGRLRDPVIRMRMRRAGRWAADGAVVQDLVPLGLVPSQAYLRHPALGGLAAHTTSPRPRRFKQKVLFVDHPGAWPLARSMQADRLIYRPTDVYQHLNGGRVRKVEQEVLAACDGVVATSDIVAESCRELGYGGPMLTVPNGVGPAPAPDAPEGLAITRRLEASADGRPIVLYVGALDDRFDASLFGTLAERRTDAVFAVIGPNPSRAPVRWGPDVVYMGPQPPTAARAAMTAAHVGLMPFSDHAANQGRSPMKVLELVADGCQVVARSTPPLVAMDDLLGGALSLYSTAAEAASQLDAALATARPGPCRMPERLTWAAKSREILAFVDGLRR